MMRCFADFGPKQVVRGGVAALAAAVLVVACATGMAAFAGLLPQSDGVATAVTATPLVELQGTIFSLIDAGFEHNSAASD